MGLVRIDVLYSDSYHKHGCLCCQGEYINGFDKGGFGGASTLSSEVAHLDQMSRIKTLASSSSGALARS